MARKNTDGKAIRQPAQYAVTANTPAYANGFAGFALNSAASGEDVELEIAQFTYRGTVPLNVALNRGDLIYITTSGVLTATAGGNKLYGKTTRPRDAAGMASWLQLPQN